MSGKKSKKERHHAAEAKTAPASQQKKKTVVRRPDNQLVRGLSLLLVIIVAFLYGNTLSHDYALDDYGVILENEYTQQGTKGVGTILTTGYRTNFTSEDNQLYRPLSKVMFAIEWSIAPKSPGLNHFMNVILFALSIVLLFRTLLLYLKGSVLVPFLTAALFAIHPLHTEVVANIKGRDDILCFLFFILTALYIHRFTISKSTKHLVFAGVAFFLSFLSKESAITFVAVIPLMLYFFTESGKEIYMKSMAVIGGVTVLFLLIRFSVLSGAQVSVPVVDNYIAGIDGFLPQRATAIFIAGVYLWKMFVPYPLVCDASTQQFTEVGAGDWRFLISLVLYLGIAAFALMNVKKKHTVSFAILYFFITFSIVSNIPFLLGTNYGERLLYAPSLGLSLATAWLIAKFVQKDEQSADTAGGFLRANQKAVMVLGLLTVVYGYMTITRNSEWENNEILFGTDLQKSPKSAKIHFFYANHITTQEYLADYPVGSEKRKKIIDTASAEFRKALQLYPAYGHAAQKFAEMFVEQNKIDSAHYYFKHAIKLNPANSMIHNNYGRMLFNVGMLDEAEYEFTVALRLSPAYTHALNNMAGVHGTKGSNYVRMGMQYPHMQNFWNQKAITCFNKSLEYSLKSVQYDPNYAQGYETCAVTYSNLGDQANANKYSQLANEARLRTGQK